MIKLIVGQEVGLGLALRPLIHFVESPMAEFGDGMG